MKKLIRMASRHKGLTGYNPPTAAAVVKNGEILGLGCHEYEGGPHAEVLALKQAGHHASGADLYVTLEPCTHFGKTPPCAKALVEAGIKRVFYACDDPNPDVRKKPAASYLNPHHIEVVSGVLKNDAEHLIDIFTKNILTKTPFILMKAGISLDGKIALSHGESKYITNSKTLKKVHQLRKECGAVMVGPGTVRADNPFLNLRYGFEKYPNPKRIIIDLKASLSFSYNVFLPTAEVLWVVSSEAGVPANIPSHIHVVRTAVYQNEIVWEDVLPTLYKHGVTGILFEGGQTLFTHALRSKIVDRLDVSVAPKLLGGKAMSLLGNWEVESLDKAICLDRISVTRFGDNVWISGKLTY